MSVRPGEGFEQPLGRQGWAGGKPCLTRIQAQRAGPAPGGPHGSRNMLSPAGPWAWHRRLCLFTLLDASSGDAPWLTGGRCLSVCLLRTLGASREGPAPAGSGRAENRASKVGVPVIPLVTACQVWWVQPGRPFCCVTLGRVELFLTVGSGHTPLLGLCTAHLIYLQSAINGKAQPKGAGS